MRATPQTQPPADAILATDEDQIVSDEDQLVDAQAWPSQQAPSPAAGDIVLRHPMAQVTLAQVSWSGPIDHTALAEAVRCSQAMTFADQIPALEVWLNGSDQALVSRLGSSAMRGAADVIRAAHLPDRLAGVEPTTRQAVSTVLAAYRRAALSYAWHALVSRTDSAQLNRERDEAAVAVLSTLRALLGER